MYDFNSLLDEVLRSRQDITKEEIMGLIEERKKTIGAGFLTDQGALFLIAGELGVQLQHTTSDLTLKDLYAGANDTTVLARVLAIYPVSEYKKKDGGVGRYRRLVVFDQSSTVKLTIWDDNPEAIRLDGVSIDSPVRILNAYVRQGLDGKPALNLGRRGRIEVLQDEKLVSKLSLLATRSKRVSEINESEELVAVEGVALGDSRSSTFTRQDGSTGSLTQFELGEEQGEKIRVVVWNASEMTVKEGQRVTITNVRLKQGVNREREVHGDSASIVRTLASSDSAGKLSKISQVKTAHHRYSIEAMVLSSPRIRDVKLKDGSTVEKAEVVFGDDTGEITVVGWRDIVKELVGVDIGEKVRILDVTSQSTPTGSLTLELGAASKIERVSAKPGS